MSTFTNQWNGPGNVPGDLTIIYARLNECRKIIEEQQEKYTDFNEAITTAVTTAVSTARTALETMITSAGTTTSNALTALGTAVNTATLTPSSKVNTPEVNATSKVVTPEVGNSTSKLKFLASTIEAMQNFIIAKEWLWANRMKVADRINFKMQTAKGTVVDSDASSLSTDAAKVMESSVAPVVSGDYVLAVVDGFEGLDESKVGSGTVYFTVQDSAVITAVVNFSCSQPKGAHYAHGSLNVAYTYDVGGQDASSSSGLEGIHFAIVHTTSALGKDQFYVVCYLESGSMPIGHTWMVGRNVRRYDSTKDQSSWTQSNYITEVRSEPGLNDGRCHGNLLSGLVANTLEVQDDFYVKPSSLFEVGGLMDKTPDGLEIKQDTLFKKDVTIEGHLDAGWIDFDRAKLESMHVTHDLKVGDPANGVVGDLRNDGNTVLSGDVRTGDLYVQGTAVVNDTLNVGDDTLISGNLAVGQSVDINGSLIHAPNAATTVKNLTSPEFVKTNKIISNNDKTYLEYTNALVTAGVLDQNFQINSNTRPVIKMNNGVVTEYMAFLSDQVTGVQFQQGVTAFVDSTPNTNLRSIELENGLTVLFKVGDTVLVKGAPPALYRVASVGATGAVSWLKVKDYPMPPRVANNGSYWTWDWFGLAKQSTTGKYSHSYIIWNPNNSSPDDWVIADLHMEMYRIFSEQDAIDATLGAIASVQPDWFDENPMMQVPTPVPPNVPDYIPNPAFINNKPWFGVTTLSGGDWDAANFEYDMVVRGGDFDESGINLGQSLLAQHSSQVVKNGFCQLMHGRKASMLPSSTNTAFVLKFCTDTNELYIDTGSANVKIAEVM